MDLKLKITAQNLCSLSDWAYCVDQKAWQTFRKAYPQPENGTWQTFAGQDYFVIDAYNNLTNGLQMLIVAPRQVAQSNERSQGEFSTVIVAFAGTGNSEKVTMGFAGKNPKDISQDIQGIVKGQREYLQVTSETGEVETVLSQFTSAQNYLEQLMQRYPQSEFYFTGHSLGGSLAMVMGAHFQKQAQVFSAPDPWRLLTEEEKSWMLDHPDKLINYRHANDAISTLNPIIKDISGFTGLNLWAQTSELNPFEAHLLKSYVFNEDESVALISDPLTLENMLSAKITAIALWVQDNTVAADVSDVLFNNLKAYGLIWDRLQTKQILAVWLDYLLNLQRVLKLVQKVGGFKNDEVSLESLAQEFKWNEACQCVLDLQNELRQFEVGTQAEYVYLTQGLTAENLAYIIEESEKLLGLKQGEKARFEEVLGRFTPEIPTFDLSEQLPLKMAVEYQQNHAVRKRMEQLAEIKQVEQAVWQRMLLKAKLNGFEDVFVKVSHQLGKLIDK
ncbi:lipase family protein [Ligilactobacillus ceti]|uniref:Fungal lipase-type domain-containing protein n=1 Tax=Ligilactobacillus ceti DSM 22408 TaxID=1122146 RepID=A0A0R2KKG3_9LACO|nr:Mbeg1-like protein [Ligilactobacillus ceti]KRN89843.1 hypothetical protein IV53_GL001170 [Ligilactobacillus ceti DSM 22408]